MIQEFRQDAKQFGLALAGYVAAMRQLERLGLHLFLVTLGDDNPELEMPKLPPGYRVCPVPLESLLDHVHPENMLSAAFVHDAMARGDRCIANFYLDELVGYGFVALRRAPLTDQLEIVVDERLDYRYKGWTHPNHRRKHLSHARARLSRKLYPLTAGRRSVSYVAVHNLPSRLQHRDLKPVRVGYCGYVRVFGREYPFTHRIVKRIGFRIQRRAR